MALMLMLLLTGAVRAEEEVDAAILFMQEAELYKVEWTFPVTP